MTMLKRYIFRMLIIGIPAVIVFLCFLPYRRKALDAMKLKSSPRREVGLALFVFSIFAVLALTLWPDYFWLDSPGVWGSLRLLIERPAWNTNLSLMPFAVFRTYFEDLFRQGYFFTTLVNFFGNLAVFMPIGFFPALLFRGARLRHSALIGFGMSAFIEISQYFIMRNSATDDVILNTLGAILGYLLYLLIKKLFPAFAESFKCKEAE